ncbi:MAG: Glycosyl transferase family 2 [Candidatus Jorgensenbacteria bacterium GW2011_GWC1_48_8]|uniref:Glycosyl transferase family 2 n=1 Tax=Candidatus Jorgensenbacteria bacterium GW2011_GWC1_48_8 TaxID=1618666 RepID=A0A0G1UWC8_9BACT|nr:MAG: Glycosyltransferase, family 2 [Parcubacteria group bacterium GW2011_GWB1_45_10]KKU98554.1 MAG: Glycosyl transferase family 2 [Candidatus Jorgensenbacteria bacterium GW2011_GWC1_48_8]
MNPKVSVIITTYNRPESLKRAIKSVLNQDFKNFELIIVDDRSDAETGEAVASFKDSRINFIQNPKNLGGTKSLNIGLKHAKGKYVCPLDDDDEWIDAQKLSKQLAFFKAHPDYLAVGTNAEVRLLNGAGELIKIVKTKNPLLNEEIHDRLIFTNLIAHVSSIYGREKALIVGGYDENLERGKDWDLFLKLGKLGKLANLPDITVRFDEKRKVNLKYKDSRAKLRIIRKHRDYPHSLQAFTVEFARMCVFRILMLFPSR